MATLSSQAVALSTTSSCFHTGSSRVKALSAAPAAPAAAVPVRLNGRCVQVSASSGEDRCSRRDAMAVVGGVGLVGLLSLLPAGSAEAISGLPRVKPESRRKIREELEKVKEQTVKLSEGGKKNVQGVVQAVSDKMGMK